MSLYYDHAGIQIWLDDCRNILPSLKADVVVDNTCRSTGCPPPERRSPGQPSGESSSALRELSQQRAPKTLVGGEKIVIVTDPPYPDDFVREYRYELGVVDALNLLACPQFVFWSAVADFPLSFSAIHIWHKNPSNHGAQYERVFERNGGSHRKVFAYYMVNSTVAASFTHDVFVEHPSQKPIRLMRHLVGVFSGTILDPFMGSGTTLVAAKQLGRKAIGIEIEEKYAEIAARRLEQEVLPFEHEEPRAEVQGSLLEGMASGAQAVQDKNMRGVRT